MALKSIVIRPGECIVLPSGATIDSIIANGSITATSTCGTLPLPTSYKCGYFAILVDNDDNPGHSMDEESTYYTSLRVGSTTYVINELVVTGDNPGISVPIGTLNLHITDTALFEFKAITQLDLSKRSSIYIYFKVPENLWDTTELEISNYGNAMYLKPIEATCDSYPDPT